MRQTFSVKHYFKERVVSLTCKHSNTISETDFIEAVGMVLQTTRTGLILNLANVDVVEPLTLNLIKTWSHMATVRSKPLKICSSKPQVLFALRHEALGDSIQIFTTE